jgi:tetratricopeptide (TPR) repeat protein
MHSQENMLKQHSMPAQGANAPRSEKGRRIVGRKSIIGLTAAALLLLAGWTVRHIFRSRGDDAQAHWQKAQQLIAERQFVEAGVHLLHCLQSWPYNAEAHFVTARTARRAGELNEWKVHLDRAEILGWPRKQIDLERRLVRAQVGDVWDVETALIDRLNTQPPEEVIILEALVAGYLATDRLIDVIAFTTPWAERYPEDWVPLLFHGYAVQRLYGKSGDAAKDFERVLELKPNNPEAHRALALVLTNQGDFTQAIPHFQFCLSSQLNDPAEALFGLATCQFSLGHIDQARQSLEQLFAKNEDHPTGCFLQAKVELADGHLEEALKWLQKSAALSGDEVDVTNAIVHVCRQLGRHDDAARYQRRLEQIHRRNDKLDRLLNELKDHPDDLEIRYQLGITFLELGRDQDASHWFQAILYKDPRHLPTLTTLIDYYEKKGKPEMAASYRRKAQIASGKAIGKSRESAKK